MEFDSSLFTGTFVLINSIICNNFVLFYAAMATFYSSAFNVNIIKCNFSDNYGKSIGAVFAALHFYGSVSFTQSIFQNNRIEINTFEGGSIALVYGDPGMTKIYYQNCTFRNNSSSKKGGVFSILYGEIYDTNSFYYNNTAPTGGLAYISGYCRYNLSGAFIGLNKAEYGGVLRISDGATVFISKTVFDSNNANEGTCFSIEGFLINFKVSNLNKKNLKFC